jgi:hypothetical protein
VRCCLTYQRQRFEKFNGFVPFVSCSEDGIVNKTLVEFIAANPKKLVSTLLINSTATLGYQNAYFTSSLHEVSGKQSFICPMFVRFLRKHTSPLDFELMPRFN